MSWPRCWFKRRSSVSLARADRPKDAPSWRFRPQVETLELRALMSVIGLSAPAPISPSGSITSAEPAFTWSGVVGADHYDVWVDDQTSGQTAVLQNQDVVGTSWTPATPLNPGDSYRWWVGAVDSTGTVVSLWSSSLDFTIAGLAAPALIGPTGSITDAEPSFLWNAVAGADHYDVWMDDKTSGQSAVLRNQEISGTSWAPTAPLHAGDNYTWWVRAVDNSGANAGSWSSGLSFSVASLGQPTALGPTGAIISDISTFTWNPVTGADHYDVWVNDLTTGQSAVLRNEDVLGTSWVPTTSLTPGHSYRWWIRAVDGSNTNDGPWSARTDFSVTVLGQPTPVAPIGSSNNDTPAFTWSAVAGADHYDVWVNDLTTGQSAVLQNRDASGTSWTPATPLHPGDSYRWWVQAADSTSTATGAWSNPVDFAIAALDAPTLIGPSASITSTEPTFIWNPVAGADHYDVWVNDVTTGQRAVLRNQDVVGASWTPTTPLHAGDTFRWWVRALDSTSTNGGAWSAYVNFSVSILAAPTLIGPKGQLTGTTLTFTWNAVIGADHYDVWVNDLTTGKSTVLRNQDVAGTSWTPATPLNPGDSYRWWVRALDNSGGNQSTWSGAVDFSVAPPV